MDRLSPARRAALRPPPALRWAAVGLATLGPARAAAPTVEYGMPPAWVTDEVVVEPLKLVTVGDQLQLDVRVGNPSRDRVVVVDKAGPAFLAGRKELHATPSALYGRTLVVEPGAETRYAFKVRGDGVFPADEVRVRPDGVGLALARATPVVVADAPVIGPEALVTAGPFTCEPARVEAEPDRLLVRVACRYVGDGLGIADATMLRLMVDGREVPNRSERARRDHALGGEAVTLHGEFLVPVTAAGLSNTVKLRWLDALGESALDPVPLPEQRFVKVGVAP